MCHVYLLPNVLSSFGFVCVVVGSVGAEEIVVGTFDVAVVPMR